MAYLELKNQVKYVRNVEKQSMLGRNSNMICPLSREKSWSLFTLTCVDLLKYVDLPYWK